MIFHAMQPIVCMCFCDSAIVLDLHDICIKNKSHCTQPEMVHSPFDFICRNARGNNVSDHTLKCAGCLKEVV